MKKQILFILFIFMFLVSCKDQIVSECEEIEPVTRLTATFSSIQTEVFDQSCATAGCHVTNFVAPDLSAGNSYNSIVNVMSFNPPFLYVYPSKSDSSYLLNKIRGVNILGEQMPINDNPLSDMVIDSIAAWIDSGALNN